MTDPSEMNEPASPYLPSADLGHPEPWSHQWHDQLGLRYHQAIAEKIRRNPELSEVAKENLRRWSAAEPDAPLSKARVEWATILDSAKPEEIIAIMTDPGEEGHQRRQSTPFAGILTWEESQSIKEKTLFD